MGRRKLKLKLNHNSEFDLDLAPLLAVMVKLVPVLLLSSAFVQMMVIETELPQVIQQEIQKQENDPKAAQISLEVSKDQGVRIVILENQTEKVEVVANGKDKKVDLPTLHAKLIEVKKQYPQIFKIDLSPDGDVAYEDLIKIMDEARKTRNNELKFKFTDTATGKEQSTDFMFPEVVFSNVMDG